MPEMAQISLKSHVWNIEKHPLIMNYEDYMMTIVWAILGPGLANSTISLLLDARNDSNFP